MKAASEKQSKPAIASKHEQHLVGDGLEVRMLDNKEKLWVEGDGCHIHLASNSGHLRVTGDGCKVRIGRNLGPVDYTGDGGRIDLGHESLDRQLVNYRGDGGVVRFDVQEAAASPERAGEPGAPSRVVTRVYCSKGDGQRNRVRRPAAAGAAVRVNVNVCVKNSV